jgi:hypothetical protein
VLPPDELQAAPLLARERVTRQQFAVTQAIAKLEPEPRRAPEHDAPLQQSQSMPVAAPVEACDAAVRAYANSIYPAGRTREAV